MELTNAQVIGAGLTLIGGIVTLWRISHLLMAGTIAEQKAEIAILKAKNDKYELESRQDMERMISVNVNMVESLLPLLEQIAQKERIK